MAIGNLLEAHTYFVGNWKIFLLLKRQSCLKSVGVTASAQAPARGSSARPSWVPAACFQPADTPSPRRSGTEFLFSAAPSEAITLLLEYLKGLPGVHEAVGVVTCAHSISTPRKTPRASWK